MTLLSREEIESIRQRAAQLKKDSDDYGSIHPEPVRQAAQDIGRLLADLAKGHSGAVYALPFGWCEANDEQRKMLARRIRHVERAAREECAKIADGFDVVGEPRPSVAYQIAAEIRALNETKP